MSMNAEQRRLAEDGRREKNWKRWGPYLADRQWATVREDYSEDGTCWDYFPHDHARSRAYRWGEDGLLGITVRQCRLCFSLALWNGRDPILKERLFGLTSEQGNHGEDVKEHYFHLDATPTHSYLKALYKYPQASFPYDQLVAENAARDKTQPEYEIDDTGVFEDGRYFDVFAEYAKAGPDDILIRITLCNRGPEAAAIWLLPTLWFRNTWSWGCTHEGCSLKPQISAGPEAGTLIAKHETLGEFRFASDPSNAPEASEFLFTDNETNVQRLYGAPGDSPWFKDAFHRHVVDGETGAVNPKSFGTRTTAVHSCELGPGESRVFRFRLTAASEAKGKPFDRTFDEIFERRLAEANEFYEALHVEQKDAEARNVIRQGYAGLIWTKQFYHFVVEDWLKGDPGMPAPPRERLDGRNHQWSHLFNRDIISMPDGWEYPWYAAWDLAFHMIPFASIDGQFAKDQLSLFLREWYMHPSGQIPAYEFALGDVNPPVHAWAAWRVYKIADPPGKRDRAFLESVFQKLLLNFTWWVNRKDANGNNLFSGGFLGLDNIGVFDRSKPLPTGGCLQQADGTAWMAFYCVTMLSIALELARDGDEIQIAYEDMASKFFEHFVQIVGAMNELGGTGLWDEDDGFYYDQLQTDDCVVHLKTRSLVGLLPLIAVETLDEKRIESLPGFFKRFQWFLKHQPELTRHISEVDSAGQRRLMAIVTGDRLSRVLERLFDETEFLAPHGIRSLSKFHLEHPYVFEAGGEEHRVDYVPGESNTFLFGGNSNWRGPIWFPVNHLLIEALERYHHFYGDALLVEFPTGSGRKLNLREAARKLRQRLAGLLLPDEEGHRPCYGGDAKFALDPHWRDLALFHEYFHAETGKGLGASHQTGWTALIIRALAKS